MNNLRETAARHRVICTLQLQLSLPETFNYYFINSWLQFNCWSTGCQSSGLMNLFSQSLVTMHCARTSGPGVVIKITGACLFCARWVPVKASLLSLMLAAPPRTAVRSIFRRMSRRDCRICVVESSWNGEQKESSNP